MQDEKRHQIESESHVLTSPHGKQVRRSESQRRRFNTDRTKRDFKNSERERRVERDEQINECRYCDQQATQRHKLSAGATSSRGK
mmetsp:Transcript_13629/g.27096  ORF Transcript_13629/g.27096 Transcript_13629/m.27096 type:complete len:85 (+) Transcript_13629:859-1113(+)